jgi:hypothetical protein
MEESKVGKVDLESEVNEILPRYTIKTVFGYILLPGEGADESIVG